MDQMPPTPRALACATQRSYALINLLLNEMRKGVNDPVRLTSPEWEVMFGNKQSVVANLHKLVQSMAALPSGESAITKRSKEKLNTLASQPLTNEEMTLLTSWLADCAASESCATKPE